MAPRKTRVTIETERIWVLEKPSGKKVWCPTCRRRVSALTPEEVAALLSVAAHPSCPIKTEKLHFVGTSNGEMVVCADSLVSQNAIQ